MILLVQGQTKQILIRIKCTCFLCLVLYSTSSAGQVNPDIEFFRDSLNRHISRDMNASFSCRLAYDQGGSTVHLGLGNNNSELQNLDTFVRQAWNHPEYAVSRIRLTGYSSIEGRYSTNEVLARERVEQFYNYLRERYPMLYRYPHSFAWVAEDWDGLSKLVRQSDINEREEIVEIIRKVGSFDEREYLLAKLNGGRAYAEMERTIFPQLRRVEILVEYSGNATQSLTPCTYSLTPALSQGEGEGDSTVSFIADPFDSTAIDHWLGIGSAKQRNDSLTPTLSKGEGARKVTTFNCPQGSSSLSFGEGRGEAVGSMQMGRALFALKTNMLLWAGVQHDFKHTTSVANVALEYYVNDKWSVELGAMYSYWRYNHNQEFQGISGYWLEPRFRLPILNDRLEVYAGVYGRVGDYDLHLAQITVESSQPGVDSYHAGSKVLHPSYYAGDNVNASAQQTVNSLAQPTVNSQLSTVNWTGDYWDAGLSAGFTFHLVGGLGLEVGVRAGYVKTSAIKYTMDNQYNWFESREKYNKVKITDLNVSLIYRFR